MQICSRPERSISECQACSITNQDTVCKKRHWILSRSKATCRKLFGDILLALLTSSGHSVLHHVNFRRPTMYSDFVSQLVWRVDKFPSNNFFLDLCTYGYLKCQFVCSHSQCFCLEKAPKSHTYTVLCTCHLLAYSQ